MEGGQVIDASDIVGEAAGPFRMSYNSRDLLIYALGIGCTVGSTDSDCKDGQLLSSEMRFLYEGHPDFSAFPTYPLVLPSKGESSDVVVFPGDERRGVAASLVGVFVFNLYDDVVVTCVRVECVETPLDIIVWSLFITSCTLYRIHKFWLFIRHILLRVTDIISTSFFREAQHALMIRP